MKKKCWESGIALGVRLGVGSMVTNLVLGITFSHNIFT